MTGLGRAYSTGGVGRPARSAAQRGFVLRAGSETRAQRWHRRGGHVATARRSARVSCIGIWSDTDHIPIPRQNR